jgi:hypothetical protein
MNHAKPDLGIPKPARPRKNAKVVLGSGLID